MKLLHDWPGKSASRTGTIPHPALYHMLDVAAVAECLLALVNLPREVHSGLIALIALHDLGKISHRFRDMLANRQVDDLRHWELTHGYLTIKAAGVAVPFRQAFGMSRAVADPLVAAVAGHHGEPCQRKGRAFAYQVEDEATDAALAAMTDIVALWPEADLSGLTETEALAISWWLSGVTVVSDLIGSNAA